MFLPGIPNSYRTKNAMLSEIAKQLESEGHTLLALASEVAVRDSLSAGDVSALAARLSGATAQIGKVTTETAAAISLALVDSAAAAWTGSAVVANGIDRLGG